VTFSVLDPNIFTDFWNTCMSNCLISEGKITDEAGVALTLQNCARDMSGFDVSRVSAHSNGPSSFPRDVHKNAGTVPQFGQDRLPKNRSD
jgi:hypothetical protein